MMPLSTIVERDVGFRGGVAMLGVAVDIDRRKILLNGVAMPRAWWLRIEDDIMAAPAGIADG